MTARIEVRRNGELLADVKLEHERITIGCAPEAQIRLDAPEVSAQHAAVINVGGEFVLRDLGSSTGTLVDGIGIDEHVLEHADDIEIADFVLSYLNDDQVLGSIEDDSVFDLAPIDDDAYIEIDAPLATVKAMNGPGAGRTLELKSARTALGIPGIQVVMITRGPAGYLLKGAKGTRPVVNGVASSKKPYALKDSDVIELAGTRLKFSFVGAAAAR